MIGMYQKKPVVIEAVLWDGSNHEEVIGFCRSCSVANDGLSPWKIVIHTLEGDMQASVGDYIIRGVKGEFYACKPDIFRETYLQYDGPPK